MTVRKLESIFIIRLAGVLILLAALLWPAGLARADTGPKPTESFRFIFPAGANLTITSATLDQCRQADCSDAHALQPAGPQHFTCTATGCDALAYGFSDYQRLTVTFSDGKTRQSNIFQKRYFDSVYDVQVEPDALQVREVTGSGGPLSGLGPLGVLAGLGVLAACLVGGYFLGLIVLLVIFSLRARQDKADWGNARLLYIIAWVWILVGLGAGLVAILVMQGSLALLSLPVTVVVEGVLVVIYALVRRQPAFRWLTALTLINLLTQPLLWLGLNWFHNPAGAYWIGTLIAEVVIWIVEAVLLFLTQSKRVSFGEALAVSFGVNLVSFLIGLLLPI